MRGREKFPRSERLTRRRDYLDIYAQGARIAGRGFICYISRRQGQGRKLGLAVSKRVGGAVVRNRIKRYIREVYRIRRQRIGQDLSLVIVARPESAKLSFLECEAAIERLFAKGDVFRG